MPSGENNLKRSIQTFLKQYNISKKKERENIKLHSMTGGVKAYGTKPKKFIVKIKQKQ